MATLFEHYRSKGQKLPSLQERGSLFEQAGLGKASTYMGTADQNTRLLEKLSSGSASGVPGSSDPAIGTAGNQDPNRAGAAKIPTTQESKANFAEAYISKAREPYEALVERMVKERANLPSEAGLYAEERDKAGIGALENEIRATQETLNAINERLGRGLAFEETRSQPLALLRGRQANLKQQADVERGLYTARLGQQTALLGRKEQLAERMAGFRTKDAQRPLDALTAEYNLRRAIPYQDDLLNRKLDSLEEPAAKKRDIRSIGGSLVEVTEDGVKTLFTAPKKSGGSGSGKESDEEKEIKEFQKDAATYIKLLDEGKMSWGAAFDALKAKYPNAENATIDAFLGGSIDYDPETGEFGEAHGRAAGTKAPNKRPGSGSTVTVQPQ